MKREDQQYSNHHKTNEEYESLWSRLLDSLLAFETSEYGQKSHGPLSGSVAFW